MPPYVNHAVLFLLFREKRRLVLEVLNTRAQRRDLLTAYSQVCAEDCAFPRCIIFGADGCCKRHHTHVLVEE